MDFGRWTISWITEGIWDNAGDGESCGCLMQLSQYVFPSKDGRFIKLEMVYHVGLDMYAGIVHINGR